MKTVKSIALKLSKLEGLNNQVNIADIYELLGHLSDIFDECEQELELISPIDIDSACFNAVADILRLNGKRRRKKREAAQAKYDKYVAKKRAKKS